MIVVFNATCGLERIPFYYEVDAKFDLKTNTIWETSGSCPAWNSDLYEILDGIQANITTQVPKNLKSSISHCQNSII